MANSWWDPVSGPLRTLHHINPSRVQFVKKHLLSAKPTTNIVKPLEGWNILDVGCGEGILTEVICYYY
jgi:2-polyprenyl-6-hydroxyphenyl methylase/3-demethylubiquinone-9 3-methyltransferase